ncbi:MAG: protein kinase [Deltaproteobacteria bacterium]|nr:protein kinase [Deltaproteobacteria bacterium]
MKWRELLRMPVGEAAKQGAAILSESLAVEIDVNKLLRRRVPRDDQQGEYNPSWYPAAPQRPTLAAEPEHDHGSWQQTAGATALALKPKLEARPRPPQPLTIDDFTAGDSIAEVYEVRSVIARNDCFAVYAARHLQWNIDVVIKAPQPNLLKETNGLQDLVTAASRWTALGFHPHIAYCYHVHFLNDVPLLILESLDGGNLRSWLGAGRAGNLRIALNLAIQICHGVEHAHSRGMYHGALTPENILLTKDGAARLTDFGIWRRKEQLNDGFVAPEQWVDPTVDSQTDIFALGVCFYEMFCGGRPYEVTRGPRRNPPEPRPINGERPLPARLAALLKSCVDWEVLRRPATLADVRRELCEIHSEHFNKPSPFAQLPAPTWDADGWNNQGMAALSLGRAEEAEAAWENALAADPTHAEATFNLGVTRWRRGEISDETVTQSLRKLKSPRPASAQSTYLLGLVYLESGNTESALPLLEEAGRREPADEGVQDAITTARRLQSGRRRVARELSGHLQFVSAVCLSADANVVLSGSDDDTLCVWDVTTGRVVRVLEGHGKRVSAVSMTPDATVAISGSDDFTLRLWDLKRAKCTNTIPLVGKVFGVSLTADGKRAVSSSSGADNFLGIDGTVIDVWDLDKCRPLRRIEGHSSAVKAVVISADGKRVVTGGDDQMVRLWEVGSGTCVRAFEGHEHYVSCVALSADGRFVVSGGWDRTLRLWDIQKGRCIRVLSGHTGIVTSLCLSPDGQFAVSGGWDGTVRIWNLEEGRCLRTLEGHSGMVTGVAISADSQTAVSGSWDTMVRLWDLPKAGPSVCAPRLSLRVPYAQMPPAEPDAEDLLAEAEHAWNEHRPHEAAAKLQRLREIGFEDPSGRLRQLVRALVRVAPPVRLRGAQPTVTLSAPDRVLSAKLSANGRRLLTAGRDAQLRLWDVDLRRCVRALDGHEDRIADVCMAANEALVVSAGADGSLRVWDLASGSCQRVLHGHRSVVSAVAVSDDVQCVLSGSYDHTLRLWELPGGECVRVFKGHTRQVTAVALDTPNACAFSGGYDATVRLWDLHGGTCLRTFAGHTGAITALCVVDQGRRVLSAGSDGMLRLWDVDRGNCTQMFEGHSAAITAAAVTPDGRWVLSASIDGTARLWSIASGACTHVVHRDSGALTALALSGDGCSVMVADANQGMHLIDLDWDIEVAEPALEVGDLRVYGDR